MEKGRGWLRREMEGGRKEWDKGRKKRRMDRKGKFGKEVEEEGRKKRRIRRGRREKGKK